MPGAKESHRTGVYVLVKVSRPNRPSNPSGNLVELQGDELEELIEVDGPAEQYAETQALRAPSDVRTASVPQVDGHRTGPGSIDFPDTPPERTERVKSAPYSSGPYGSSPRGSGSGPYGSGPYGGSAPGSAPGAVPEIHKARTADLRRSGASRRGRRQRSKISTEESIDEMLGAVLGSYRILSLIGEGGMGRVYQAEHIKLGRKVALKLLRPEYAVKRDAVARFFQEARAVNQIGDENIVDITDFVELDTGETYIIMELLLGEDLADIQRKSDQPMPLHRAMQISLQVCDALEAAHKAGIIHRDLKPDNIFIVNDNNKRDFVKLLDFGVAKLLGGDDSNDGWKTAAGSVIGTPAYMSPEQASGIPVDHRSDIYSLGAILYELFTGHPVFRAKSFGEFVVKHMNHDPIPPRELADAPSIPAALEAVILRCLEKDPARRYQSVAELREDLARATATVETVVRAVAITPRKTRERAAKSRRGLILVLLVSSVMVLAGVAFWVAAGLDVDDVPAVSSEDPTLAQKTLPDPDPTRSKQGMVTTAKLTLRSNPSGAEVFRKDDPSTPLGKTPLELRLENIGEEVAFLFRLPGYREGEARVHVVDNTLIGVDLEELPRPSGPTPETVRLNRNKPRPPHAGRKVRKTPRVRHPPPRTEPLPERPKPKTKRPKKINPEDIVDPFNQ